MPHVNTPTGKALPVPAAWQPAIDGFDTDQRLAGKPLTTRKLRRAHLANLARWDDRQALPLGPFGQTRLSLKSYLAESSEHWTGDTLRSRKTTLRCFYLWAEEDELMATNPAAKLGKTTANQPNPRPASDVAYLQALTGATPRISLMVHLANDLGLRAKEIAELHRRDVVMAGGRMLLTAHGKGRKDRTLPVPPLLAAMLAALPEGWVFPSDRHPSGHLSAPYVSKLLTRALPGKATGHTLRHRFATTQYQQEGDLLLVAQMLGHESTKTTEAYVLANNLERMARAIDRAAQPFGLPELGQTG